MFGRLQSLLRDIHSVLGSALWGALLLMSVVGLGEGMSMVLLLPLLSAIGIEGLAGQGVIQSSVRGFLAMTGMSQSISGALLLVLCAFALQMLLYVWQTWWIADLQRRYGAIWQQRLFSAFMKARWGFVARHKLGLLSNAITSETYRLTGAMIMLAQMISTAFAATVYVLIALFLSWQVTCALMLLAVVLFLALRGVGKRNYRIGKAIGPLNGRLAVMVSEYIAGAKLVKATGTEGRVLGEFNEVTDALRINHTWATFLPGFVRGVFEFASIGALCAILVVGHTVLSTPTANMLLILALFVRLLPRFNSLQQNIQLLSSYLPALDELHELYQSAEREAEHFDEKAEGEAPKGELAVDIVSAGYGDVSVLHDLRVDISSTGFIGVVGESGAGKSTFVHCLLGLCDLQQGDIRIGETSIRSVPLNQWRRAIGYVPQETILFHRSIRENIAWSREDATFEEIVAAAKKANAHEFIEALPEGYETIIGDQGVRLSGGQRQRLGIARALLMQPGFLLLDEATSALDSSSEEAVLETLEQLRKDFCIISVAHRLSTVRRADSILVLGGGAVVEAGNWSSLMEQRGTLYRIAEKQNLA